MLRARMCGMKTTLLSLLAVAVLAACGSKNDIGPGAGSIRLSSTSFADGQPIPAAYTPDGEDRAPETCRLRW